MSSEVSIGQAPGKIILFGEHAVVYREPALGFPLSRGVRVTLQPGQGKVIIQTPSKVTPSKQAASPNDMLKRALGDRFPKLDAKIDLDVAPMAGLGTSAALAIALLRALKTKGSRQAILDAAIEIEEVAHAKPSGVDPAICLWGELISFRRIGNEKLVRRVEPKKPLHVVVGTAGSHGGTRETVTRVANLRKKEPSLIKAAMASLGEATKTGIKGIKSADLEVVGHAMDLAHGVLSGMGIVSDEIEQAVRRTRKAGALGGKMSGAGGSGGAFVALAPDHAAARRIQRAVKEPGVDAWIEVIG